MKCIICEKEIEKDKEWAILHWEPEKRMKYLFCGNGECYKKVLERYS